MEPAAIRSEASAIDHVRVRRMKRIVVLIDGTWGKEGTGADTDVAKLDSGRKIVAQALA